MDSTTQGSRRRTALKAGAWTGSLLLAGGLAAGVASAADSTPASGPSTGAAADPTAATGPAAKGRLAALVRHTLHGELTVSTKNGPVTVDVDKGSVTSTTGSTVTVRSTDGVSMTWSVAPTTRVRKDGKKASAADVAVGDTVLVVGRRDGSTLSASAVVDRATKARGAAGGGAAG